jgi:hypothetical protein
MFCGGQFPPCLFRLLPLVRRRRRVYAKLRHLFDLGVAAGEDGGVGQGSRHIGRQRKKGRSKTDERACAR